MSVKVPEKQHSSPSIDPGRSGRCTQVKILVSRDMWKQGEVLENPPLENNLSNPLPYKEPSG